MGFQTWSVNTKKQKLYLKEQRVKENMELIVNLRLKIKEMDLDNHDLVGENHKLRKTSMDGIYLAQTWKELSEKIRYLSVDLAGKHDVVKELIDENSGLAKNINLIQKRANKF